MAAIRHDAGKGQRVTSCGTTTLSSPRRTRTKRCEDGRKLFLLRSGNRMGAGRPRRGQLPRAAIRHLSKSLIEIGDDIVPQRVAVNRRRFLNCVVTISFVNGAHTGGG